MNIDLVMATYNRAEQLRATLENVFANSAGLRRVYVVDNASQDHTRQVLENIKDERLVRIYADRNLGAAAGKNVGLRQSDADVIIVIDDDALFFTGAPANEVKRLFEDDELGVVQFKIVNFQSQRVLRAEFPGADPENGCDESFEIGYFIGAGHALRKSMLETVGYYPDDFGLYAHEEIDLSYRAVNGGYRMRYCPSVGVWHMKTPSGRLSRSEVIYSMFLNRLVMSRKYLPARYALVNNFLWFAKTVIDSRTLTVAFSACLAYWKMRAGIRVERLSPEALAYMLCNRGRIFK